MKNSVILYRWLLAIMLITGSFLQTLPAAEPENIVVYGASGRIGKVIVDEALARGYRVQGVSRNPAKLDVKHSGFSAVKGDVMDVDSIRKLAAGADAVVIAITARAPDNRPENSLLVHATKNMLAALDGMDSRPYIVQIGGANLMYGSTFEEVSENMQDAPFTFDKGSSMYAVLFGHQISVQMYRESDLDWTVLAPPMKILGIYANADTTTTRGSYRVSTSGPVVAPGGSRTIYVRDLARAAVDEIEKREFVRQVFTVGY